jgi:hypothetical protein
MRYRRRRRLTDPATDAWVEEWFHYNTNPNRVTWNKNRDFLYYPRFVVNVTDLVGDEYSYRHQQKEKLVNTINLNLYYALV